MYIIIVNGELFVRQNNKTIMNTRDELIEEINSWSGERDLVESDGDILDIDEMIDGGKYELMNKEMCERGDDFVEISICTIE